MAASISSLAYKHGSDKGFCAGLRHGHTQAYASALSSYRDQLLKLLEIGLSIARWGLMPQLGNVVGLAASSRNLWTRYP